LKRDSFAVPLHEVITVWDIETSFPAHHNAILFHEIAIMVSETTAIT